MKRSLYALSIALLTAGCVHGTAVEQVHAGMSRGEVAALMGPSDGSTNTAGRQCEFYTVTKDFWSRTPWSMTERYQVCFIDGKVDTFGIAA
jgi:hypothetical protein